MQTIRKQLRSLLFQGIDVILPPRCVITGELVEEQGMISGSAWAKLDFVNDPMCATCGFPFEFEVDENSLCTSCLTHAPPFEMGRMALKYNDTSRDLILGFKHGDQTHAVKAFTPWLIRAGKPFLDQADIIAPVPLHFWRQWSRKYNQAALIAQELCKYSKHDCRVDLLKRIRATPSQGYLKAKERYRNVKRAFAVNEKYKAAIKDKKIVLVDDVYTTGATIKECAKELKKAGAHSVFVLTLARVVRPESYY